MCDVRRNLAWSNAVVALMRDGTEEREDGRGGRLAQDATSWLRDTLVPGGGLKRVRPRRTYRVGKNKAGLCLYPPVSGLSVPMTTAIVRAMR